MDDEFVDSRVLLVLTQSASRQSEEYTAADFSEYGCTAITVLNEAMAENGDEYRKVLCLELGINSRENALSVIDELILRDDVLYAGPDRIISVCSTSANDTFSDDQWAIDHINLPQAWDYTTGSADITVGVLDSGIDGTHPELSEMIDRSLCRDFTSGSEVVVANPTDPNGHGTHVAGIIGAAGNNSLGVTGVNWNIGLVPLRVFGSDGRGSVKAVADAIDYAERMGISILNYSGGWGPNVTDDAAFNALVASYSGILICSAGNDHEDNDGETPNYPASYTASNIIAVGAINDTNERWEFSNYGVNSVDIYAPGEDILSTYPEHICEIDIIFNDGTRFCEFSAANRIYLEGLVESNQFTWSDIIKNFEILFVRPPVDFKDSPHYTDGYHYMTGTSMSTPYVTGVAALLLCENPQLTAAQIKAAILNNANTINITLPTGTNQSVKSLHALTAIMSVHTAHTYDEWTYYNSSTHIKSCCCGAHGTAARQHIVKSSEIVNYRANCLECGYLLDLRTDMALGSTDNALKISVNGSYILPSGIIVLVDEDVEAYLSGTLLFYDRDDLPVTQ